MKTAGKSILTFFTFLTIAYPGFLLAQEKEQWGGDGELEDVEIEIVRERQITLPRANRNFEKIPPRPAEPIKPEITYDFRNLNFNSRNYSPVIRPLRLKQEDISKIYGGYVSAGFGNYSSPFLDAWFNSKRDKEKFFGAHLFHESFGKGPVDGKNSASGETDVRVFGQAFGKTLTTGGFVSYQNRSGYFYGYQPGVEINRDTIRQAYNIFSLGMDITNSKPGDFGFKLGGAFSYLQDYYNAVESEVSLNFNSDYKISDQGKIIVNADYYLITRKDSLVDAEPRHLLSANGAFQFSPMEKLSLRVGGAVALENDSIRSKSFHIYPDLEATYNLTSGINAYARLNGGIDKVSLHTLSSENLWLAPNIGVFHSNRTVEFTTGLNGKLGRRVAFGAGFSGANLKDWYFYQTDSTDRSKIIVLYDQGNTQRINFFGELGYNHGESVRLLVRGDYFAYSTDKVADAWHRPLYQLRFNSTFNIYQKVVLNGDASIRGGMKAFNPETDEVTELDAAIDLGVKLDYNVSKKVSVFVKFNNLLASEYPLYLNYAARGFQVKGGLTWAF